MTNIMRVGVLGLMVYVVAVLETSLADVLSVGHVGPDLLGLVATAWTLVVASPYAFLAAGGIGLVSDLIGPGRPGVEAGFFLLLGYGVARLRARLSLDQIVWQAGVVWVAVSLLAVAAGCGRWLLGETAVPLSTLAVRGLGVGLYTAGIAVPVLMVLGWLRESFATDAA